MAAARALVRSSAAMSAREIDDYLAGLDPASRAALEALRSTLLKLLPDAEQGISYGMPALKVGGKAVAGFAAFKKHLSYFPHSSSVLPELGDTLEGYETSKGALRFAADAPLPVALVRELVEARLREIGR